MKSINKKRLSAAVLSCMAAMSVCGSVWAADVADLATPAEEMEFTLDTMIVTAGRIPTKITEAKADVSVVTRKEIEDMHVTNVEEALRTVPGVQFSNYGGTGMNANMSSIRINGSKEIVVLVDGVRVTDFEGKLSGNAYTALMNNMDNIERIEVLRGSAGTIYGSAAKGGVINIITRKINDTKTTIDVAGGSFDKKQYKLNTMVRRDKLGINVYYDKDKSGDIKDGSGKTWPSKLDSTSYGVKFTYDISDDHVLTLSYDQLKSEYSGYDNVYTTIYDGSYNTKSITSKDDITLSDKWSNSFTYRHNKVRGQYAQNGQVITDGDNSDVDYKYDFISDQATFKTSRHTVVMGFDYSRNKDNKMRSFFTNGDIGSGDEVRVKFKMDNKSFYIQDDWVIIPKVTLSGGIRHDKPSVGDGGAELDSNTAKSYKLSWDITENDSLYAGRSDFFILPSMANLTNKKWGNSNLKAANGRNSTIGYTKKFDEFNIVTLNWFKTDSTNEYVWIPDNSLPSQGKLENGGIGVARGWNLQYMTEIGEHWSGSIGWAHLFQHLESKEGKPDNYEKGYYPKDLATFSILYNNAKLKAGLNGYYFMRKKAPWVDTYGPAFPADNYAVINLSTSYAPTKNISFYAKVNNLFDKLYAEHTHTFAEYGTGAGPGNWYSMPGRSFVVGMQYTF